jgi:peptidylprolyl isomerase
MTKVRVGDRVKVQYLAVCKDGTVIRRHGGRQVLDFVAGSKQVIPGISFGVVGMIQGEEKRFTIQPSQAYGPLRPRLIREVPRQRFPKQLKLFVGKRLVAIGATTGRRRRVRVVEIKPQSVIVDGNHPLAGKILEVELQLVALDAVAARKRA